MTEAGIAWKAQMTDDWTLHGVYVTPLLKVWALVVVVDASFNNRLRLRPMRNTRQERSRRVPKITHSLTGEL